VLRRTGRGAVPNSERRRGVTGPALGSSRRWAQRSGRSWEQRQAKHRTGAGEPLTSAGSGTRTALASTEKCRAAPGVLGPHGRSTRTTLGDPPGSPLGDAPGTQQQRQLGRRWGWTGRRWASRWVHHSATLGTPVAMSSGRCSRSARDHTGRCTRRCAEWHSTGRHWAALHWG
jgi:hypothetical protein